MIKRFENYAIKLMASSKRFYALSYLHKTLFELINLQNEIKFSQSKDLNPQIFYILFFFARC